MRRAYEAVVQQRDEMRAALEVGHSTGVLPGRKASVSPKPSPRSSRRGSDSGLERSMVAQEELHKIEKKLETNEKRRHSQAGEIEGASPTSLPTEVSR